MMPTTLSRREFNQNTGRAERVAEHDPVFITDRSHLAYAQLAIADYRQLTDGNRSLSEALAQSGEVDFEFNPAHVAGGCFKPADVD